MFIICLENTTKKKQHGSKVNYVKIFFVEQVSSQTQGSFINKAIHINNLILFHNKPENISKKLKKVC